MLKSDYIEDDFIKDIISRETTNYEASVIEDSINGTDRLITLKLKYPRYIHGELMTHKWLSRNASSSRAIPTEKEIERIKENPAVPIYWGANQSGMQAREELNKEASDELHDTWLCAMESTIRYVNLLNKRAELISGKKIHKQTVNRLLEPFQLIETVITANENKLQEIIDLRLHPDAQPEIIRLAYEIFNSVNNSTPVNQDHHLPFITDDEWIELRKLYEDFDDFIHFIEYVSAGRCARASYRNFDGSIDCQKDYNLANRLASSVPPHMSPFEHVAIKGRTGKRYANFYGWINKRTRMEEAYNHSKISKIIGYTDFIKYSINENKYFADSRNVNKRVKELLESDSVYVNLQEFWGVEHVIYLDITNIDDSFADAYSIVFSKDEVGLNNIIIVMNGSKEFTISASTIKMLCNKYKAIRDFLSDSMNMDERYSI